MSRILFAVLIGACQNTYEMGYDYQHDVLKSLCRKDFVGVVKTSSQTWSPGGDEDLVVFLVTIVAAVRNKYKIPSNDLFRVFIYGLKGSLDMDIKWNLFWVAGNVIQNGTHDQFWTISSSVQEADSMVKNYAAVKGLKYYNELMNYVLPKKLKNDSEDRALSKQCIILPQCNSNECSLTRIYPSALTFLPKAAGNLIEKAINDFEIPDINAVFPFKNSTVKLTIRVENKKEIQLPTFVGDTNAEHGLVFRSHGGLFSFTGSWKADFILPNKILDINTTSTGWLEAAATGFNVNLTGKVNSLDGHLQLEMSECKMELDSFDYYANGTGFMPDILNVMRSMVEKVMKFRIRKMVCTAVKAQLIPTNLVLRTLPLHFPLYGFHIKYALDQPAYTDNYADLMGSFKVTYGDDQVCDAATSGQFTEEGLVPQMTTLWLDESLMMCGLTGIHESGIISIPINKKNVPVIESFLKTSCSLLSVCMGKFFKKLRKEYPNQYIEMMMQTTEAPHVYMTAKDGITIGGQFALNMYIDPRVNNTKPLATIILNGTMSITPMIVNRRLSAKVSNLKFHLRPGSSEIGDITFTFLAVFETIFSKVTKFLTNNVLKVGIPIPSFANVTISDATEISVFDKCVRANVGFEFEAI
ncbi:unnamed protein product [Cylicocyclus nassatus]|uniref:Lipid-binding serum glycoprotein C-terminal domain-containing protein n=1 Tax=Cylicocyclus nassatus TaxID=53992 RepID=A0AA36M547_CYLNA|nr:unnamed protein product [Cylicocyclus nassatus]